MLAISLFRGCSGFGTTTSWPVSEKCINGGSSRTMDERRWMNVLCNIIKDIHNAQKKTKYRIWYGILYFIDMLSQGGIVLFN